jgi:hypothetical protein
VAASLFRRGESVPRLLILRLASIAVTASAVAVAGEGSATFVWMTYSLGLAHYALALGYAGRPARQILHAPLRLVPFAALVLLAVGLYRADVPLLLCFGIHHALNEAYLRRTSDDATYRSRIAPTSAAFHLAAYLVVLRDEPALYWLQPAWSWAFLLLACVLLLRRAGQVAVAGFARRLDVWAPELTSAILVGLSLLTAIPFLHVVLFHFVLWGLLPIERLPWRGRRSLPAYLALSTAISAAFLVLSPLGVAPFRLGVAAFTLQFFLWSYLHILLSFALSDAQPDWIVRAFRGAPSWRPAPA